MIIDLLTINKYSRPSVKNKGIKKIVVHWVANPKSTAKNNRDYFENLKNQTRLYVSAHYIVGLNGEIIQCIPEDEISYHAGNLDMNYKSIGIECCHQDSKGRFNDDTYDSLIDLVADLCIKYNLDPKTDVIRHYDVIGKECPRFYVKNPQEWELLKNDIYLKIGCKNFNCEVEDIIMYQEIEKRLIKLESENKKIKERVNYLEKISFKEENAPVKKEINKYKVKAVLGLNIRSGAGTHFYKVGNYKNNEVIEVLEIKGKWARTNKGYIHTNYIWKI